MYAVEAAELRLPCNIPAFMQVGEHVFALLFMYMCKFLCRSETIDKLCASEGMFIGHQYM